MTFPKLGKKPLPAHVEELLRDAIISGRLSSGDPLREAHIAEDMGVSRAPIRAALQALEESGLAIKIPYKGTFVSDIRPEEIEEIMALRSAVEPLAAHSALSTIRDGGHEQMQRCLADMRACADAEDSHALVKAHVRFHRAIYEMSSNQLLLRVWELWEAPLARYLAINHHMYSGFADVVDVHQKLLDVLMHANQEELDDELRTHVEGAARDLTVQMRHGPTQANPD